MAVNSFVENVNKLAISLYGDGTTPVDVSIITNNIEAINFLYDYISNGGEFGTISTSLGIQSVDILPSTGIVGMVVYLTTEKKLYVYDGTTWSSVGSEGTGIQTVSTLPSTSTLGTIVYLTTDNALHVYNGTAWVLVGGGTTGTPTTLSGFVSITGYYPSGEPIISIGDSTGNQALHVSYVTDNTDEVDGDGVYYLTTIVNAFLEFAERNPYLSGTYYWLNRAITETLTAEVLRSLIRETMQTTEYVFSSTWQTWARLVEPTTAAGETVSISGYVGSVPTFVLATGTNASQTIRDYVIAHKNDLNTENKRYLELIVLMFNRFVNRNPEITGAHFWLSTAITNAWSELTLATAIYQSILTAVGSNSETTGGGATIPNTNTQVYINGAPVIIVSYATDGEPLVSIGANENNNEVDKQYILDNTHQKTAQGHYYVTVLVQGFIRFFGRNPECNGCAWWLRTALSNGWTKVQLEDAIYQAGILTEVQVPTDSAILVNEQPTNPTQGTVVIDVVNGDVSTWDGTTSSWVTAPYVPPVGAAKIQVLDSLPANDDPLYTDGTMIYLSSNQKMYVRLEGMWKPYFEELAMDGSTLNNVGVVSGLPATGLPNQTVFNTIDNKLYKYTNGAWAEVVQAVDVAQAVAAGSISTASFAQGLTGVEIVATLPTTGNFAGRMAFLTTNNKLYNYNGTAWVETVGSSVTLGTNSITAGMIAANAVTAGTIAAGAITATEIAAGSISTSRLAVGAVTANQIAADAINATHIAAGAITASEIASNAITAGAINAGAVTATKISSGAITATHLSANCITAGAISAGSIDATKLSANSVTAQAISAGTITAGKIVANDIAVASTYTVSGVASTVGVGGIVTITSANTNQVGYFTVSNTNPVAMKILCMGTGRSGVLATPQSAVDALSQTFGIFIGTTKIYEYGWSPLGQDVKVCSFTYTVPANGSVSFTLRAARSETSTVTTHNMVMNFNIFGVRN